MLFARFAPILFALAVAGALAGKRVSPAGLGTMRTDNATFVVQSFRPAETPLTVWVAGRHARLRNLETGETIDAAPAVSADGRTGFRMTLQPHSFAGFRIEG